MKSELAVLLLLAASAASGAEPVKPRVAIVIDDFGLNYKKTPPDEEWAALASSITWAIMPESPRTKKAAALSAEKRIEAIIHYPFDPFQALELRKDEASASDLEKVEALLEKSRKQIPNAVGLNNHRSYRGTRNRPLMKAFMTLLKPTGLFFLDSKVSEKSVAHGEAKAAGIPSAINFVFLDTAELHTQAFCARSLRQAVARARKTGAAVAIGHHYYRSTLDCVREEAARHAAEGVEFVPISALVR